MKLTGSFELILNVSFQTENGHTRHSVWTNDWFSNLIDIMSRYNVPDRLSINISDPKKEF